LMKGSYQMINDVGEVSTWRSPSSRCTCRARR
jgi:hypothetical protein